MSEPAQNRRPNILLVMTDQLHHPPAYESDELAAYRKEHCAGQERLRANGVSFTRHYPISAACAPSRASLLTGHHPSLHGVSQTPGLTKSDDGDDMFWLAPDDVPTMGDWFRAAASARTTRASGMPRTRTSMPTTETATCSRSTTTASRRRRTSSGTWRLISSMRSASRSGSAPSRTASVSTTPERSRTSSPRTRRSSCCSAWTATRAMSRG